MDRPHLRVRVGRARGRVERRVLDVVAHAVHEVLAHRLDVHERAAVVEPELAVLARSSTRYWKSMNWCGRADVELDVLEDRRHVGVAEVRARAACGASRSGSPPSTPRSRRRACPGWVCFASTSGMPTRSCRCPCSRYSRPSRRERAPREVGEREVRDRTARSSRRSSGASCGGVLGELAQRHRAARRRIGPCPSRWIEMSWPGTSARSAPTVHCSRGRLANGSKRYQRIAFSCVILFTSSSGTPNCAATCRELLGCASATTSRSAGSPAPSTCCRCRCRRAA